MAQPRRPAGRPVRQDPSGGVDARHPGTSPDRDGPPAPPEPTKEDAGRESRGILGFLRELPGLILIAFALALLIKTFVIQAFFIPSRSMLPTLEIGDRVIVNKFIYNFGEPQHGDVVVFENPHLDEPDRDPISAAWHWLIEGLGFTSNPNKDFIKRVIGVPGDVLEITDGKVLRNGKRIPEPYVSHQRDLSDLPPTKVRPDHVFVMGDNRPNSQDSRNIGQIPYDKIVGEAFLLLWPPSRTQWLSGD